jgi:hypothetical protein
MEFPFHHAVAERLALFSSRHSTKPLFEYTYSEIKQLVRDEPTLAENSKKQYLIQMEKIEELLPFSKPTFRQLSGLVDHRSNDDPVESLRIYVNDLRTKKDTPASNSTKKAFMDVVVMLGDLYNYSLYSDPRGNEHNYIRFPIDEAQQLRMEYDIPIQKNAVEQVAEVPSQDDMYTLIQQHTEPATLERCLLTLFTYVPLRDDAQVLLVKYPSLEAVDITNNYKDYNTLVYIRPNVMYLHLRKSKTVGKNYYPSRTYKLPSAVCEECDAFFTAIGWPENFHSKLGDYNAFPFGTVKHSQRLIQWTDKMGIKLRLVSPDGSVKERGAGIDYFRRVNRAAAGDDPELIAQTAFNSAHSILTSMKYRAIQTPLPASPDCPTCVPPEDS